MKERVAILLNSEESQPTCRNDSSATTTSSPSSATSGRGPLLPAPAIWIGTFHAFCVGVLRRFGHLVNVPRDFSIVDEADKACGLHMQHYFDYRFMDFAHLQLFI
jgi:superfamily I DNA/RNA helicase